MIQFLGKNYKIGSSPLPPPLTKSYRTAASIVNWPEISQQTSIGGVIDHPLHRSLVGTFNDPFYHSPNPDLIQKWFLTRWKVTPLDHNQFLFEFPSRQELIRVKAGEWFWNERHLNLSWWSKDINSQTCEPSENIRLKVFGIPLSAWTMDTFEHIRDNCRDFIGVDEDTKNKSHFHWARICVKNLAKKFSVSLNFESAGWLFELVIITKIRSSPLPVGPTLLWENSPALNNDYYTKGPKKRKTHKENYSTLVWRAAIAKADPCSFRLLSSVFVASFDPFELEIQASNHRKLEHEAGAFSQLVADDETENPVPYLGTCRQYPITTIVYDSNSDPFSQSFNSLLPLP
ncbi:hypothetical protein MTR67_013314 [Solanum verrucosum]|uniref:DUF4283 domain-containing protein n=1 Tax=Solanum verrucosum TaxID=315347 RepID=A0AAF0TIB3_SOLVR|nr:hypothetical protein MTR67_013314 [Solanum verrucosum]